MKRWKDRDKDQKAPENARPPETDETISDAQTEAKDAPAQEQTADNQPKDEQQTAQAKEAPQDKEAPADLKPLLEASRQKAEEYLNLAQRVQADFDNFRRRTRENDAKAADIYKAETLKSFLPVLDNFELALAHMKKDESGEAYIQGFELLQKQLVKIMTDYGISEIEAAGQKFDPHFHEAVMMVESNDKEDETVLAVFQKGYMYKDTVLRPAKVQVVHNN